MKKETEARSHCCAARTFACRVRTLADTLFPLGLIAVISCLTAASSSLENARDRQDVPVLEKAVEDSFTAAAKAPNDPDAQYRAALACSYLAEVQIEQHDKKKARPVAVPVADPQAAPWLAFLPARPAQ